MSSRPEVEIDAYDLIQLLSSTPADRAMIQSYIEQGYGLRVPKSTYEVIIDRLEEELGTDEAADAVCEIVLATASPRLRDLLNSFDESEEVSIRMKEPRIVDLIFDYSGEITALGELLMWYRSREATGGESEGDAVATESVPASLNHEVMQHFKLSDALAEGLTPGAMSANPGAGWRLERVRASAATFLKAEPDWLEADLEDFIVENWRRIDFGFEEPLQLVGRQVRLSQTREKVDLLGKSGSGLFVAIELKIVPAGGSQLTQLLSYMQDLAFQGIPASNIRGVLLAPGFSQKVIQAAGVDRRVLLMRFLSE